MSDRVFSSMEDIIEEEQEDHSLVRDEVAKHLSKEFKEKYRGIESRIEGLVYAYLRKKEYYSDKKKAEEPKRLLSERIASFMSCMYNNMQPTNPPFDPELAKQIKEIFDAVGLYEYRENTCLAMRMIDWADVYGGTNGKEL